MLLFRRALALIISLQFSSPTFAADVSGWHLQAKGLGAIAIGMTVADASKVSDTHFEQIGLPPAPATFCTYFRGQLAGQEIQMRVVSDRIDRIEVSGPGFSTLSGVKVGDSIERVKRIYGKALAVEPDHYSGEHGVLLMVLGPYGKKETGYGVAFTASPDKGVTEIWVGLYSGIRQSEGCF
jgi:hypothetical protein